MPETIDCGPKALANAAKCYCISDVRMQSAIEIYLLATIAGDTSTPAELARKAACFCMTPKQAEAVKTYLLCQIVNVA